MLRLCLVTAFLGFWLSIQAPAPDAIAVQLRSRVDFGAAAGASAALTSMLDGGGSTGMSWNVVMKGDRIASRIDGGRPWLPPSQVPHEILDFNESRQYKLFQADPSRKQYESQTFAKVHGVVSTNHLSSEAGSPAINNMVSSAVVDVPAVTRQSRFRARRFVYAASTEETGVSQTIAGYPCRQVFLRVEAHEENKSLELDGGWVVSSTVWVAPELPAFNTLLDKLRGYRQMVSKGIFDAVFADVEMDGAEFIDSDIPEHVFVAARVIDEMRKLRGSVLQSRTVYDMERTAKEQERAISQYDSQQRRLAKSGAPAVDSPPSKRTTIITMEFETLSISDRVSDADVAIPPGFVVKK